VFGLENQMNSIFQNSNETVYLAKLRVFEDEIRRLQTKLLLGKTDSDRQTAQENVSGNSMVTHSLGLIIRELERKND
jgi:hypothetical protein